ncbi:MAG: SRPBCC family protein [Planctomycetes bacterium]|nr:SRPBCC family protein [Planctomycetota bacterium]
MHTTTDSIHKEIVLRAPRTRVWRALTNATEFGAWFGVKLDGEIKPKARLKGPLTSCGHENVTMDMLIERVEPEHLFSYRWHPYALDPKVDYSSEQRTLVEFQLEEVKQGTRLTVVESGFDQLPPARRELAFPMHEGGWVAQLKNVERHVASR